MLESTMQYVFWAYRHSYDLPLSNEPSQSKNRQLVNSKKVIVYLDGFSPFYAVHLKIETKSFFFKFLWALETCIECT